MHVKVDEKTQEYVRQAQQTPSKIVTEDDLAPLPMPVQRYLRFTQVVGKPRVKCVKVRQTGWMRTGSNRTRCPLKLCNI
jgi:hypothetical protein